MLPLEVGSLWRRAAIHFMIHRRRETSRRIPIEWLGMQVILVDTASCHVPLADFDLEVVARPWLSLLNDDPCE